MKKYQCHKVVEAAKIFGIEMGPSGFGPCLLQFAEGPEQQVHYGWVVKHTPQVGGYFVRYNDGYESYSPAEAFEDGYHELSAEPKSARDRVVAEKAELDKKLARLNAFLADHTQPYTNLSFEQRGLLLDQVAAMADYSNILQQRLEIWV